MPNEHARKCVHCGQKAHNSRTCSKISGNGFKLFGVQIDVAADESRIRKSKSLGNLQACSGEITAAVEASGYLSDGLIHQSSKSHERKKGSIYQKKMFRLCLFKFLINSSKEDLIRASKPWSEEEHRSFLVGLERLGKGDWKGIANSFVPTRNSSQVASHAQKYFIRKSASEKKRRRTSVFDIPLTDAVTYNFSVQQNKPSQVLPGSQVDKAAESSQPQPASSWAASSKNNGELKGPASIPAPVTTSERPPLSPMKRRGIPDLRSAMVYAPRVTSFSQGFPTQTYRPTLSWVPVMSFSSQASNLFLPNFNGTLTNCAKFVPQPSIATAPQKGSSAPTTNNDETLLPVDRTNEKREQNNKQILRE
ncbi:hypothetical protein DH2020_034422 [Rehmannia glutinosa]|uniref:Uncharacterized protein n=1 Tax=Rehmannia glutinosa TaxID=99300 RepID=A0ABR0V9U3_REHGL